MDDIGFNGNMSKKQVGSVCNGCPYLKINRNKAFPYTCEKDRKFNSLFHQKQLRTTTAYDISTGMTCWAREEGEKEDAQKEQERQKQHEIKQREQRERAKVEEKKQRERQKQQREPKQEQQERLRIQEPEQRKQQEQEELHKNLKQQDEKHIQKFSQAADIVSTVFLYTKKSKIIAYLLCITFGLVGAPHTYLAKVAKKPYKQDTIQMLMGLPFVIGLIITIIGFRKSLNAENGFLWLDLLWSGRGINFIKFFINDNGFRLMCIGITINIIFWMIDFFTLGKQVDRWNVKYASND
jgi:cation transport ATPase